LKALPAPGGSPGTSGVAIAIIEQPHVVVSEQARRADLLPGAKKAG
jgi:hypothetical protein